MTDSLPLFPSGRDRTRATFEAFHAAHPEVFELFKTLAIEIRGKGFQKYSARTIVERIRWHYDTNPTHDGGFKMNDHVNPHYARLLMEIDPTFRGFFELREETP